MKGVQAALCMLLLCGALVQRTEGRRRKLAKRKGSGDPLGPEVEMLEHGNDVVYKPADFDPRKAAAEVDPEGIIHHIVAEIPNAR